MTAGALVATQLTDHSSRVAMLTIAGVDVIRQPGAGGNKYGVPTDSISVDEQAAPGVSTLAFRIEDALGTGPVPSAGDEVQYWDLVNDVPYFGGWVTTPVGIRDFGGGQGRAIDVSCVGFESILDWAVLTADLVIPMDPGGTVNRLRDAIQLVAANCEGIGALRTFSSGATSGSQAQPVGALDGYKGAFAGLGYPVTITAGTSLREAINQLIKAASSKTTQQFDPMSPNAVFTIDFYRGLRVTVSGRGGDYTDLTVTDTTAGVVVADGLKHETEVGEIVRGVYVKGLNAGVSGYMGDGSGKPGRIAYVSDDTIDTAAKLLDAQQTYLADFTATAGGSFDLSDWTPSSSTIHPGSSLFLTDAATGATGTYRIASIGKTFNPSGRETWAIAYGRARPSLARAIRHLTRAVRS